MIPTAFYAPLKAPDHPTPSGDRQIARALLDTLRCAGFAPTLASNLRSLDTSGHSETQAQLRALASVEIPKLVAQGAQEGWRAWVSYHNYYKAPDLLGPAVSAALGIPYVQIESTRAKKRLTGPWADFAAQAEAAADAADAVLYFTDRDAEALRAYRPERQILRHLPPFLNTDTLPPESDRTGAMLAVGMMRKGDKLDSYHLIAKTLALIPGPWQLDIAGDGAARGEVEAMMAPFGSRVRFLGQLDSAAMQSVYRHASLLFWPGVNEAIGMVYLEAQAAGIPVLAQNRPGLREIIAPGLPLASTEHSAAGLARTAQQFSQTAPCAETLRHHIEKTHLRPAASNILKDTIGTLI